jgi:hypothetical protein
MSEPSRIPSERIRTALRIASVAVAIAPPLHASAQTTDPPATFDHARDRGPGIPVSMFGTYVERGELLVYPFVEYYRDGNAEYTIPEVQWSVRQNVTLKLNSAFGVTSKATDWAPEIGVLVSLR